MTKLTPVLHSPIGGIRLKVRGASTATLLPPEREIILTLADDEKTWRIHTDSRRALNTRLLKVAKALGVSVERVGAGYQFTLPLNAVSFRAPKPLTEAQAQARTRSIQKALRFGRSAGQNRLPEQVTTPTAELGGLQA